MVVKKKGGVLIKNKKINNSPFFFEVFTTKKTGGINSVKKMQGIKKIYSQNQVHSKRVTTLTKKNKNKAALKKADGLVTNIPGHAIGVKVADCAAIALVDPGNKAIGVVHSGRRGMEKEIPGEAIRLMEKKFGSKPGQLVASVSPCIGPCHYEVGADLYNKLKKRKIFSNIFIIKKKKIFMDIKKGNMNILLRAGLSKKNIYINKMCTMCNPGLFHSYRRDKDEAGRMFEIVMIKK